MRKKIAYLVIGIVVVACTTNPLTGRKSFQGLADNSQLMTMAFQQYEQVKKTSKIVSGTKDSEMIKRVGERIKTVAENYYKSIGQQGILNGFNWEFNLIEDKNMNAWCMPGGKVAFFTGILPVCKDETGVATVMGHEVAHALAGHGAERMSQQAGAQLIGAVAGGALGNSSYRGAFEQLYPLGASMTILSYSRKQELDADEMGLYLMAKAGYDPTQAPQLWVRMKGATSDEQRPPDFLSTHPNPENRIADLQNNMQKALEFYNNSPYKKVISTESNITKPIDKKTNKTKK
jgi:predicted Zn-dependent protease